MMSRLIAFLAFFLTAVVLAGEKPNFVVCIADDLSDFDTEPYGAKDIRTPHLKRLAAEGAKFTHCFVASPSCCPSRTALLTGLWPARNGAEPNHMPKRPDVPSLIPELRKLGYEVASFGKVAHYGQAKLFDFDHVEPDSAPAKVREWLIHRDPARPLCLFLGTDRPHVPWSDPEGYDPASFTLPANHLDTPETRQMRAKYATDVTKADAWMGEMDAVAREFVIGDTLRIFTADHGSQWPFGKWNLYDDGIRIPFIAVWPGKIAPASTNRALISWPDLLPGFIELAGGTVPPNLDGRSLAPVLREGKIEHRDRIFTTHSGDGQRMNVYPIRSVRTREWKYIRNLRPDAQHHSHISRAAGRDGLVYWLSWIEAAKTDPAAAALVKRHIERPAEELYDLVADPHEQHNLAADPAQKDRLAAMRRELDAWMHQQGDTQRTFGTPTLLGQPAPPLQPGENKVP